jgi:hypothetical protein
LVVINMLHALGDAGGGLNINTPSPALPRTPPPQAGEGLGEREVF